MVQTLELKFLNENEKVVTLTVDNPTIPVDPALINQVMDKIVENNVFTSTSGMIVAKQGARLVNKEIVEIEL
ncbi:DUF2922 domain-containing protein [Bacillus sp. AFS055030]|uniref:DUF2922 domain-containing protein n=1 Tax=Bacillus sp. AFS055030 TaxID=2033507 RepID=UPI000BFD8713|nr:DUF2922 domain-containing protein [Bacillus sp. AFS055030]PGL72090.1 hypothetical protein CN925_05980 [Bacillus sp. AFS055030]